MTIIGEMEIRSNAILSIVQPLAELEITEGFCINFDHKMPNRWWRFWQRVFFGFKWRNLTPVPADRQTGG